MKKIINSILRACSFAFAFGLTAFAAFGELPSGYTKMDYLDSEKSPSSSDGPYIVNGGFETGTLSPANATYGRFSASGTEPTVSDCDPWSGLSSAGVTLIGQGSPWAGTDQKLSGSRCAFVQMGGRMQCAINVPRGYFKLSLLSACRSNNVGGHQMDIYLDDIGGTPLLTFKEDSKIAKPRQSGEFFIETAGEHTLIFKGTTPGTSDTSSLIDEVSLTQVIYANMVAEPTFTSKFLYNKQEHQLDFSSTENIVFGGTTKAAAIGVYEFTMTPAEGFTWEDKSTDTLTRTWSIEHDHVWGEWTTNTPPTCTATGERQHVCTGVIELIGGGTKACGVTETEELEALGHDYDEETGVCTRCGKCEECDYDEGVVLLEPTCLEPGVISNTCTVCGIPLVSPLPALGHDYVHGFCSRCGTREPKRGGNAFLDKLRDSSNRVERVINAEGADIVLSKENPDGSRDYTLIFPESTSLKLYDTVPNAELILIGGGGGGGCRGGGGGAGGFVRKTGVNLSLGDYSVVVGAGGAGGYKVNDQERKRAKSGGATTITGASGFFYEAMGGGIGASENNHEVPPFAGDGASGGGASIANYHMVGDKWFAWWHPGNPGKGEIGQGHDGGKAYGDETIENLDQRAQSIIFGGGGGAGAAAPAANRENKGKGGDGVEISIVDGTYYVAGGGGGGNQLSGQGVKSDGKLANGGLGGGGGGTGIDYGGSPGDFRGTDGGDGQGAGGGGGGNFNMQYVNGGRGGNGVVILNYTLSSAELYPVKPPVNFLGCEPTGETTVKFNWLLRGFGQNAKSAAIKVEWTDPITQASQTTVLTESAVLRASEAVIDGFKPGRTYTFNLYALNDQNSRGDAEKTFTVTMPGGKTIWSVVTAAQNKDNALLVDFEAKIGYVGVGTSTARFRYKYGNDEWQAWEDLGTFDRAHKPAVYTRQKAFLDYDIVRYQFEVSNAAPEGDITWTDLAEGQVVMSDGKITESYWATKTLGFTPVLDKEKKIRRTQEKTKVTREYNYYTHEQDPAWGSAYTGTDTFILANPTDGDNEGRPLIVFLHGRGGSADRMVLDEANNTGFVKEDCVYSAPNDFYCLFLDNGRGYNPNDTMPFDYWWGATGNRRGPEIPGIKGYRDEPPTAKRVLDCVEWVVREKKINRNRIYMAGNSMGGQGSLAIGLTHGEVFAAVEGNVPATVWYISARMNFVDDKGVVRLVGDRDATVFNDPPPCFDWSGSNDIWSRNHEVLMEAMNRFHYNYSVVWGDYGHCTPVSTACEHNDLVRRYNEDWKSIVKNEPYPCFSNVSGNDQAPWPWASVVYNIDSWSGNDIKQIGPDGSSVTYSPDAKLNGQRNALLRWKKVSDTATAMEMELWVATKDEAGTTLIPVPESQTADVTVRRIQGFKLLPGQPCAWSYGGKSGVATADAEGLVTVNVTLTHTHQTLTLTPGVFDHLVAKATLSQVGEHEISFITKVQALGGAASAAVALDYRKAGAADWSRKDFGTQVEEPALRTLDGLEPGTAYELKVTFSGAGEPVVADLGTVTTAYAALAATVELGEVSETAAQVSVVIEKVGTLATDAAVTLTYRAANATSWTTKDCGRQGKGGATYAIDGLVAGNRYLLKATVDNGVDAPAEFNLGEFLTATGDEKTLVDPPAIRDLVYKAGVTQKASVPENPLWTVTANAGGIAVGTYAVTLQLTNAAKTRWVGTDGPTISLSYRIVDAIKGVTLPAGTECYSENGDVILIFRRGAEANATFDLAFDTTADLLLIGGGGPGGWASTYEGGLPGAGGGAGGMLELSKVPLRSGRYTVTVGAGGKVVENGGVFNSRGGDSSLVGEDTSISVIGGGGGGHAVMDNMQGSTVVRCIGGASSGGSLLNTNYGCYPAIGGDEAMTLFREGQGNYGGRISSGQGTIWVGSVGGGGAGEPAPWADTKYDATKTTFLPGGNGRVSSITGEAVHYAGGGAGGAYASADVAFTVAGTLGGGAGAHATSAGEVVSENGVDGFGGGGAGGSVFSAEEPKTCKPGRGGDGLVVIRLKEYVLSGCAHANARVTKGTAPNCTEGGFSDEIYCEDCHTLLAKRLPLKPLGHSFAHTQDGDFCSVCGEESRFSKIEKLYWSDDRRYVFVDAHRGAPNEAKRIPHSSAKAFREAIALGADVIELDPRATLDNVIVLMHDANMVPEVYGTPSGTIGQGSTARWYGQVENYKLKVSETINEDSGEHVLTMAEALDICKDNCFLEIDCNFWTIDTKMNLLWDLICSKGMQRQCIFRERDIQDWLTYQRGGVRPADMVVENPDRYSGLTLNQNQPDGVNDRSSHPDPTRWGWQRVMDKGMTVVMTDEPENMIAYLNTMSPARHTLEIETDTRRLVTPVITDDIVGERGQLTTYGAADTEDYVVIRDEGGAEAGEYYVELELRDAQNTRWTDASDGRKKMWYHLREIDPTLIDGLPTDYANPTAEYEKTGSANGLTWANAARAYAIGDETVLVFTDPNAATSFKVNDGFDAEGRYLLVGGGGPGGLSSDFAYMGNLVTQLAGAGGGAGGMLEGTVAKLVSGTYDVTVGAGGVPGTNNARPNNKGGDSSVTGGVIAWTAFGGGGGGHGSTDAFQKDGARGVNGGSSGGSIFYFDTNEINKDLYGSGPSISEDDWNASFVAGQGNHGGRVAGYNAGMRATTVGGGGAGESARAAVEINNIPGNTQLENYAGPGGKGRASDITGMSVTYAGGGAGGVVCAKNTTLKVPGGFGGGGSTDFSRSDCMGSGVNSLGGGGAGASYRNGTMMDKPGNGGNGVVVVRLRTRENGSCKHDGGTYVSKEAQTPTCENGGWTAEYSCSQCHAVVVESETLDPLGHDFSIVVEDVKPVGGQPGHITKKCSRCEKTETTIIPATVADLPTDMPQGAAEVASGDVPGISWTGAAKAWTSGGETVIVFTDPASAGSLTVDAGKTATVNYLAVGGGGSGGTAGGVGTWEGFAGAGGGAGGFLEGSALALNAGAYAVKVGAGGASGANGGDSFVALGDADKFRAFGGRAAGADQNGGAAGGAPEQGFVGGNKVDRERPGGGGGAGAVGSDGQTLEVEGWLGGFGGAGKASAITGNSVTYAGGGAGGCVGFFYGSGSKQVPGGAGGGGSSEVSVANGCISGNGVDELGGGGAGGCVRSPGGGTYESVSNPGRGGNGVVVIRVTKIEGGDTPVLPKIGDDYVEPAEVFTDEKHAARTDRPIVYPTAPQLEGEVGSQTIKFVNSIALVPPYYTAKLSGTTIALELNDKALAPLDATEPKPFDVNETTVSFTLKAEDIQPNLYYGVVASDDLATVTTGWSLAGTPVKGSDLLAGDKTITVEKKATATKQFYKLSATDVPPSDK